MKTQAQTTPMNDPILPVESDILGLISVPEDECLIFTEGILGFPACRRFILVPTGRPELFWLQSVEHGSLAFLLVDPFSVAEDFSVDLSENDLAGLEPDDPGDIGVLAIVTLPRHAGESATANLQGLLAVNFAKGLGRQVVIAESNYGIRWPVDVHLLRAAS